MPFKEQLDPPNGGLPLEAGACPDKVVRGRLPDVNPPESATVSPSSGGHLVGAGFAGNFREKNDMHPEDLMKPDLLSEILLLGGGVIFAALLLMVVLALTRA